MSDFTRYAIYCLPEGALASWGAGWLGWDVQAGQARAHPQVAGLDVAALTEVPRRYGLHATIKPPFRLMGSVSALQAACEALCAGLAPVEMAGLELARLGRFLALRPVGGTGAPGALAAAVVAGLDGFRAPPGPAEVARRRVAGLSARQETLLGRWGYPHVMEAFRFHITLTGPLPGQVLGTVQAALTPVLAPLLPVPFSIGALALVGEDAAGRFHLLRRFALRG